MQYLLIDAHKRFLGTLDSKETLVVGDTFLNTNNQTYAVVGLDWSHQRSRQSQSLTVIKVNAKKAQV